MDDSPIPSFAELAADPEIAPLLTFTPVPRKVDRHNGWKPDAQREFIALLAWFGIPSLAAKAMDKNLSGISALYKLPDAKSFRAAWDAALALGERRNRPPRPAIAVGDVPGIAYRGRGKRPPDPLPGQVLNEKGAWEDPESMARRVEEAGDSIRSKLLRARRLYLMEISGSPGKRAAFQLLTELAIDWDKAAAMEPQASEPYTTINQHKPDMVLTAESGWSFGEIGYGPPKRAELRRLFNEHLVEQGQEPIPDDGWGDSAEG